MTPPVQLTYANKNVFKKEQVEIEASWTGTYQTNEEKSNKEWTNLEHSRAVDNHDTVQRCAYWDIGRRRNGEETLEVVIVENIPKLI